MKKCFNFPSWNEVDNVLLHRNEESIFVIDDNRYTVKEFSINKTDKEPECKIGFTYELSIPSDPILAKLCELTGAKMYGDYIVLEKALLQTNQYVIQGDYIDHRNDGNYFICIKHPRFVAHSYGKKTNYWNTEFLFYGKRYTYALEFGEEPFMDAVSNGKTQIIGNIFHEYSKFLRKEENKWEECKMILEI